MLPFPFNIYLLTLNPHLLLFYVVLKLKAKINTQKLHYPNALLAGVAAHIIQRGGVTRGCKVKAGPAAPMFLVNLVIKSILLQQF